MLHPTHQITLAFNSPANYFILNIWNAVLQGLCTGHGSQIRDKSCLWRISKAFRILNAAFHIFQDSSSFSYSIHYLHAFDYYEKMKIVIQCITHETNLTLLVAHSTRPTRMSHHDRVWSNMKWYAHILALVEIMSYVRDKVATLIIIMNTCTFVMYFRHLSIMATT